ncbi:MAG: chorismate-binding protein [Flammeovirgaceae bacterium]|nr:chorismate-binding protein [Flammeovirgaceae bacterium]MDW8286845.1 chorismate-binding protein [Flammeovirgaceae bacterium]
MLLKSSISTSPLQVSHAINALLTTAFHKKAAVAIWKKPFETKKYALVCLKGYDTPISPDLETMGEGFLIAPFDWQEMVFFLHADWLAVWENDETILSPESNLVTNSNLDAFFLEVRKFSSKNAHIHYFTSSPPREVSNDYFLEITKRAIDDINDGKFQKVVLSRASTHPLPNGFDTGAFFEKLTLAYPTAFVSLVSLPHVGTWIGASPELLVSLDRKGIFRTVALAGTQPLPADENLKEVAWKQKEIEEQAMVSRYIINCFKKIRLREFEEIGPRTARAGHLVHLKTDFVVDTVATNFPQLATVMLSLLHPTSAVCGMPKEPALSFIKAYENYQRSLYSGFLGAVNIEEETHLFVNLRCLQLQNGVAYAYAGAGITADSVPEKEWQETMLKMNTLLKILRS